MHEQSKGAERRIRDWHYTNLYFVGDGLDVGAGPDGLSKLTHLYPGITSVRDWDLADGDAQYLTELGEFKSFDFISASHVLEHLEEPKTALYSWIDRVKPGGHLIVTVPDYTMYERDNWPSRHGVGHLHGFTSINRDWGPVLSVPRLLEAIGGWRTFSIERMLTVREHFDETLPPEQDQSLGRAECAIEFVLRRR